MEMFENRYWDYDKDIIKKRAVAHRGLHGNSETRHKENTLEAFKDAWALGLKYCECDIHAVNDILYVSHDPINEYTDLTKITKLTDVLEYMERRKMNKNIQLIIEVKEEETPDTCFVLNDLLMKHSHFIKHIGYIISFKYEGIDAFRGFEEYKNIKLMKLYDVDFLKIDTSILVKGTGEPLYGFYIEYGDYYSYNESIKKIEQKFGKTPLICVWGAPEKEVLNILKDRRITLCNTDLTEEGEVIEILINDEPLQFRGNDTCNIF